MAIQVVTAVGDGVALSNSVRTQYIEDYLDGAMPQRLYDQIASPMGKPMSELEEGSSVQIQFLSDMTPGTTAISEVSDIEAQTLTDATVSVTPTSRGEALKASEKLLIEEFPGYRGKMLKKVGSNMMETVDSLARDVACQGTFVVRECARSSLDAGATGHRADDAFFLKISGYIQQLKIPGFRDRKNGNSNWPAIMHPMVYHDILKSGNVVEVAKYQNAGTLFNHEFGAISGFRLVVSPWAKVFYGQGAANAKVVDTVLAADAAALAKTLTISNTSSLDQGAWLNILDTAETANTHVGTNERIRYVSDTSKVVTFIGEASNGGLRFAHLDGVSVTNADSVYTIVFGGHDSLAKIYATEIGEFGQIVGPRRDGTLDQWLEIGWKWYGNYGRLRENGLVRAEVAVSVEA